MTEQITQQQIDVIKAHLANQNITLVPMKDLESILAHPEEYPLESAMVQKIQSLTDLQKDGIRKLVAHKLELNNTSEQDDPSLKDKIISCVKMIWEETKDSFDQVFDTVVDVCAETAQNLVEREIENPVLAGAVSALIGDAAQAIQDATGSDPVSVAGGTTEANSSDSTSNA